MSHQKELVLPWPPRVLNPNNRSNWRVKSKAAKAYKEACWALAKEAGWSGAKLPEGKLHLWLDFYPPDKRLYDDDNVAASFKSGRDGVALALNIDDKRFISHPYLKTEIGGMVKVRLSGGPVLEGAV